MSVTAAQIPNYKAGTWNIDPVHSEVSFTVRHMGISKVKGRFTDFSGSIVTATQPEDSSVSAVVQVASVNTNNQDRDAHLRSGDFFLVDEYPEFSFQSTSITLEDADSGIITGELTLRGVTKEVSFNLELGAFATDAYGNERLGLSAKTTIDRSDYGMEFNAAVEATGALIVSNKVAIELEISAVLNA